MQVEKKSSNKKIVLDLILPTPVLSNVESLHLLLPHNIMQKYL